jgi:LCP family protein required for cell wall assembly
VLPRRQRRLRIIAAALVLFATLLLTNLVIPVVRLSRSFGFDTPRSRFGARLANHGPQLQGAAEDRINVLLAGITGGRQESALLTDAMVLLSVQPSTRRAAVLSIPRDLWIPYPDGSWQKVNEAYRIGDLRESGAGGRFATTVVGALLGVPIPYFVVIDFSTLKRLVDVLGGVPVQVDRSFTDAFLSSGQDWLHPVAFAAGWQWLDGERALQFARSRQGDNGEGSDFARAKRQQKILLGLKEDIFSWSVLLNPVTIHRLVDTLETGVRTNLGLWEMVALATMGNRIDSEHIVRTSLAMGGLLVEARGSDNVYLLRPRDGDFSRLRRRAQRIFSEPLTVCVPEPDTQQASAAAALPYAELPKIIPRSDWDPAPPPAAGPSQQIYGIVIHHDALAYGRRQRGEEKMRTLLHVSRGARWSDVPYHYLIDLDGRVFAGRAEHQIVDTHSDYDPADCLHVALLGNYSELHPTDAQIESLVRLVLAKAHEYGLPPAAIKLQGDLVATESPGRYVRERLEHAPWVVGMRPQMQAKGDQSEAPGD